MHNYILPSILFIISSLFIILYAQFRWENSIEGRGTMLLAVACILLAFGLVKAAVIVNIIVISMRLLSLHRARKRLKEITNS